MNTAAAGLIGRADGLSVDALGILRATASGSSTLISDQISAAIRSGDAGHLKVERTELARPLSLTVSPLPPAKAGAGQVILFIADPEQVASPSPDAFAKLFALTRSEARLVAGLVSGASLDVAAEMSSITLSSARTYLKSIFAKTGVVRQAELVQLVLTSSAAYVND